MPVILNSFYNVSIWRPVGVIELKFLIYELSEFKNVEKKQPTFNRFADLSKCDFSQIKFDDIRQIYLLRKTEYKGPEVKSIFFVNTDLQFGIARMYQTLMEETPIKVEVCKTEERCSQHLNIPINILFQNS